MGSVPSKASPVEIAPLPAHRTFPSDAVALFLPTKDDAAWLSVPSPATTVGEDIALALLMASQCDRTSALYSLPRDIVHALVALFVPSATAPYLHTRPLSRSYYRICEEMPYDPRRDRSVLDEPFGLSTEQFDASLASVDLVQAARQVLRFLLQLKREKICFRDFSESVMNGLFDQYLNFLFLRHRGLELLPSLEIQAIWFSHMLQSEIYSPFAQSLVSIYLPKFAVGRSYCKPAHCIVVPSFSRSFVESEKLLGDPANMFSVLLPDEFRDAKARLLKEFTPQMAIDDQLWFDEFLKFNAGVKFMEDSFLQRAHLGYQRMLSLKFTRTTEMEEMSFAPCPSIDLFWHAHLLHPQAYRRDMELLLGHVPAHKLLEAHDRTRVSMLDRDVKEESVWRKAFGESLFVYGLRVAV